MIEMNPHLQPSARERLARYIGHRYRGFKGVDRLVRLLNNPDRRQVRFLKTIAQAVPDGP
jgi:hypothetical protein